VAADGPRQERNDDAARCAEARRIATQLDWPCELKTLFRESNLGCGRAVAGAISWFFQHEVEGIILEDDCLPDPTFFPYCTELLIRYRQDFRIFLINGNSGQLVQDSDQDSYYFSRYPRIWGWATWRRSWDYYDFNMSRWPALRETDWLQRMLQDRRAVRYWCGIFDRTHAGAIDTWDYQLIFSCWVAEGLCATPWRNLVCNIGFGPAATRTTSARSHLANQPTFPLFFPLRHPHVVLRHATADHTDQYSRFDQRFSLRIKRRWGAMAAALFDRLPGKMAGQ
jgi:hypothetical protein